MYTPVETAVAMKRMINHGTMPRFLLVVKIDKDEVGQLDRKLITEKLGEKDAKIFDVKKACKSNKKFEKFLKEKFYKRLKKFSGKKKVSAIAEHQVVPYTSLFAIPDNVEETGYTKEKLETSEVLVLSITTHKNKKR